MCQESLGCKRGGDLIPGKRFWAPSSDPKFSRPCSHFLYLLSCVMDLPMCSGVFLRCLEHLPSWFPLNILYFPKETYKMENRTWSPGSVAETLSIQIWECCDDDFHIWKTGLNPGTRVSAQFRWILFYQSIVCPDYMPGDHWENYSSCLGSCLISIACSYLLAGDNFLSWTQRTSTCETRSSHWGPYTLCEISYTQQES